jgi:D-glycero-alpha-D-manno-heptose-7-phosphate kinase
MPYELAMDAINIEQNRIGESVGVQDQISAAYGGIHSIELSGKQINVSPIQLSKSYTETLESHIMLGFSGIDRLADVHAKQQVENIKTGKSKEYLKTISRISEDAYQMFKQEASMKDLGALLDQQWLYKRKLTNDVTSRYIDNIYDKAVLSGAYGGKLMGAGGGGFFMFLASPEKHDIIKKAIPEINGGVPLKFVFAGSKIIMER